MEKDYTVEVTFSTTYWIDVVARNKEDAEERGIDLAIQTLDEQLGKRQLTLDDFDYTTEAVIHKI